VGVAVGVAVGVTVGGVVVGGVVVAAGPQAVSSIATAITQLTNNHTIRFFISSPRLDNCLLMGDALLVIHYLYILTPFKPTIWL
jgi:hypothetical protein